MSQHNIMDLTMTEGLGVMNHAMDVPGLDLGFDIGDPRPDSIRIGESEILRNDIRFRTDHGELARDLVEDDPCAERFDDRMKIRIDGRDPEKGKTKPIRSGRTSPGLIEKFLEALMEPGRVSLEI